MSQVNPLSLSDDDFDVDALLASRPEPEEEDESFEDDSAHDAEDADQDELDDSEAASDEEDQDADDDAEEEDPAETDETEDKDEDDAEKDSEEDSEEAAEESETPADESADDEGKPDESKPSAEDELAKLYAPFRANNKEMKIDSVDDAIQLMQMGANYASKMAALKPNLKVLRTLEKHNLLTEDKINYLIDLDKKDPAAIAKLIKDSGIDPLDVNVDEESTYSPKSHAVTNSEVELAEVLDELRDSPSFSNTIDIVGNKWDDHSRDLIAQSPAVIRLINDHVADGTYEVVMDMVQKERMMGRLDGVPDVVAYDRIGTAMRDQGLLGARAQPAQKAPQKPADAPAPKKVAIPADIKNKQAKRAAASPRKASPEPKKGFDPDVNPLSLPDEEFDKLMASKYR